MTVGGVGRILGNASSMQGTAIKGIEEAKELLLSIGGNTHIVHKSGKAKA